VRTHVQGIDGEESVGRRELARSCPHGHTDEVYYGGETKEALCGQVSMGSVKCVGGSVQSVGDVPWQRRTW
jgi:hypothetical protein